MVKSVIEKVLDQFAGIRIAVDAAAPSGAEAAGQAVQKYIQAGVLNPEALIEIRSPIPSDVKETEQSPLSTIVGPIMGGMMIFFAFFTGGSTAQSILTEDEKGTLARLFTTPTRYSTILQGKFLAVGLTVFVQVVLLLVLAHFMFGIQWGALASVALAAVGIITCAAAFGIFLTSLMKSTRQGGAVYGGLITVTGMLGMLTVFTGGNTGGMVEKISLLMPQGWAVRGLTLAMNSAGVAEVAVNLLVLLALSGLFMGLGVWNFQRRFA
jgi:ABC-type multidrug transport system permease subunit